jgi:hypothetical protein
MRSSRCTEAFAKYRQRSEEFADAMKAARRGLETEDTSKVIQTLSRIYKAPRHFHTST